MTSQAAAVQVPFVGCKSGGQVGPQDAPTGRSETVDLAPALARNLAFYRDSFDWGILAPRGWHCFGTYGSAAANLYVTLDPLLPSSHRQSGTETLGATAIVEGIRLLTHDTRISASGLVPMAV